MTNSNRFLNRLFVFVVGFIMLVGGGAVAAGALIPDIQQTVSSAASDAGQPVADALQGGSWILWVAALVSVLLVVLFLVFAFRHGGGRTSVLLRERSGQGSNQTGGSVVIDAKVAQQVLEEALSHDSNIVSVDVTAFEVKGEKVLRLTANARRGAAPADVRRSIERAVRGWDALLGRETPIFVQIVGGLRTQVNSSTARVV